MTKRAILKYTYDVIKDNSKEKGLSKYLVQHFWRKTAGSTGVNDTT